MKTAIVWGAGGGIGRSLCKQLKEKGWQVAGAVHSFDPNLENVDFQYEIEISNPFSIQNNLHKIIQDVNQIDLFIYAAGDIVFKKLDEMTPESWQTNIDANLSGPFLTYHFLHPLLSKSAHLVFLGAVSERLKLPGMGGYVAAKAGLEALTAVIQKEERNMKVTLVRPGAVDTPFWDRVSLNLPKDAASPDKVAGKILDAVQNNHKGQLDLT